MKGLWAFATHITREHAKALQQPTAPQKKELFGLLADLASAMSHMDNGLFRDFQRDREAVIEAARELVRYYDSEVY